MKIIHKYKDLLVFLFIEIIAITKIYVKTKILKTMILFYDDYALFFTFTR